MNLRIVITMITFFVYTKIKLLFQQYFINFDNIDIRVLKSRISDIIQYNQDNKHPLHFFF